MLQRQKGLHLSVSPLGKLTRDRRPVSRNDLRGTICRYLVVSMLLFFARVRKLVFSITE